MSNTDDHESDRSAPEPVSPDPLEEPLEPGPDVAPETTTDGPLDRNPTPGHLPSETGVQAERPPFDPPADPPG